MCVRTHPSPGRQSDPSHAVFSSLSLSLLTHLLFGGFAARMDADRPYQSDLFKDFNGLRVYTRCMWCHLWLTDLWLWRLHYMSWPMNLVSIVVITWDSSKVNWDNANYTSLFFICLHLLFSKSNTRAWQGQ